MPEASRLQTQGLYSSARQERHMRIADQQQAAEAAIRWVRRTYELDEQHFPLTTHTHNTNGTGWQVQVTIGNGVFIAICVLNSGEVFPIQSPSE